MGKAAKKFGKWVAKNKKMIGGLVGGAVAIAGTVVGGPLGTAAGSLVGKALSGGFAGKAKTALEKAKEVAKEAQTLSFTKGLLQDAEHKTAVASAVVRQEVGDFSRQNKERGILILAILAVVLFVFRKKVFK